VKKDIRFCSLQIFLPKRKGSGFVVLFFLVTHLITPLEEKLDESGNDFSRFVL
jgi:hypothetical protein